MTTRSFWLPLLFWLAATAMVIWTLHHQDEVQAAALAERQLTALEGELRLLDTLLPTIRSPGNAPVIEALANSATGPHDAYHLLDRQRNVVASTRLAAVGKDAMTLFGPAIQARLRQDLAPGGITVTHTPAGPIGLLALADGRIGPDETLLLVERGPGSTLLTAASHQTFYTLAVLAFGAALLLHLFLVWRTEHRIARIGAALRRFAEGDGAVRVALSGSDAIGRLALQFNDMADRIGQARSDLAESEERLKFALHGSNIGIWDWRIDSGHTYYSPRWKGLLGYDEREVLPHSEEWLKRVHPDDFQRVMAQLRDHMSGSDAFFESEHRLRRKDGGYIWVHERGVALRDADGTPYRMVGAISDISRRKEIESALQRSEEAYRSVVNAVTQVIFRSDDGGRLTFLNPAWADLTGIPVATALAQPLTDFVAAEDRDQASRLFAALSQDEEAVLAGEFRLTTRNGGQRWFSLHARSLRHDRGETGIAGLLTDIDALKKAQDALTQSNKERNTILDLSPDGYVFIGTDARVVYVNPAFLAMTGLAEAEIVGRELHALEERLLALCDPARPLPGFSEATDDQEQICHLVRPEKTILKWLIRHIRDQGGNLQAGVIFFRNVTAEVEVDNMKSEFLSTAAHELRTPMASIYGFAELLLAREFDPATQRDLLQRIHRQTKNLTNLVNELLDLARIEARGSKTFKFQAQELTPVVLNTLGAFYVPPESHSLETDLPRHLPIVNIDADKIHQALTNVLGNALKYSPAGGTILVRAVERSGQAGAYVGIAVEDQGIGMTTEQMAHMFDRFYRADTSGAIPGTGLGMCLVKEIMGIHGGEVTVSSQPGVGTEVTLWLPVVRPAPGEDADRR